MGELATELQYFSCRKYLHTLQRAHLETYWTHTHQPECEILVFICWHIYITIFSLLTLVLFHSPKWQKKEKKKFQWHIDLEHKYRYATSRLRSTVQKWSYQIQSLFGCFSEMAAVFFFLINIFFQSFSRWNGHHCAKGKLNVTNPQLLSDVLCFILLLWPQDGAQLTDMATH